MERSVPNPDPLFHTKRIRAMLEELSTHLREDAQQVADPRAQGLFETAAEVLMRLDTAFEQYERSTPGQLRGRAAHKPVRHSAH